MNPRPLSVLVRTWLVIACVDFLFASALTVFAYDSTFSRLWTGVASVPLGPGALDGGPRVVLLGIAMHLGVALTWSAVFLGLVLALPALRQLIARPAGVLAAAAVYGPLVWIAMSFGVIQFFTGRPPTIGFRWWVQFFGHIPFVALPIVWMVARAYGAPARATVAVSGSAA